MLPALAHVGAVGFFADRVQVEIAHEMAQARIVGTAGRSHFQPGWLPLGERIGAVAPHDLIEGLRHELIVKRGWTNC